MLQATLLLLGRPKKDTETWATCRAVACADDFTPTLLGFDAGNAKLPKKRLAKVRSTLKKVGGEAGAERGSVVALILFKWIHGVLAVYDETQRQRLAADEPAPEPEEEDDGHFSEEEPEEQPEEEPEEEPEPEPEVEPEPVLRPDEAMSALYVREAAQYNDLASRVLGAGESATDLGLRPFRQTCGPFVSGCFHAMSGGFKASCDCSGGGWPGPGGRRRADGRAALGGQGPARRAGAGRVGGGLLPWAGKARVVAGWAGGPAGEWITWVDHSSLCPCRSPCYFPPLREG